MSIPKVKELSVELCTVPTDYGKGANDGAYYSVGLLTLGTYLKKFMPEAVVSVVDLHHEPEFSPSAQIVGISASSTLNYRNVLELAKKAKDNGSVVVVGGPHATQLTEQILRKRVGLIDFVVRGKGEIPFSNFLKVLQQGSDLGNVPNLSWRNNYRNIVHNPLLKTKWQYDDFLPLDLSLLRCGLKPYWDTFKKRIDLTVDAAFVVFTHFGCGYREIAQHITTNDSERTKWCSYCSLNDPLSIRTGQTIVKEALGLIKSNNIPKGSNILLKCYGDNVGTQQVMLFDLALAIAQNDEWSEYKIGWTFYSQSSRVTEKLAELLVSIGTRNLYIGFDSADNDIQKKNGMGTSLASHKRASRICQEYGIKIQAGFVVGCAGETKQSLEHTLEFASELASKGLLERINAAVLFIIPGSPAYQLLCNKEPWIKTLDTLPTEELQWYWVKHFCPKLADNPTNAIEILHQAANCLDGLSPGPHASMGFLSKRFAENKFEVKNNLKDVAYNLY